MKIYGVIFEFFSVVGDIVECFGINGDDDGEFYFGKERLILLL